MFQSPTKLHLHVPSLVVRPDPAMLSGVYILLNLSQALFITWHFEKTLKAMYVPASQGSSLYKQLFTSDGWFLPFNNEWTLSTAITKYESTLTLAQAHGLAVEPIAKVQVFLTRLPLPVYEPLKLNRENQPQNNWENFKEQAHRMADELQMKYLEWLRSPASTSAATFNAKRVKLGAGGRIPTALTQSCAARTAAVSTGPGSSNPGEAKCGVCNLTDHTVKECPFYDTNVNFRREGFDPELQGKVRSNPKQYIANGKPNNLFTSIGGKVSKVHRKPALKRKRPDKK